MYTGQHKAMHNCKMEEKYNMVYYTFINKTVYGM